MVRVSHIIKDGDGDIIAVRGKEMSTSHDTKEKTWTVSDICQKIEPSTYFIVRRHTFYVKYPNNENEVTVDCQEKKNGKLCLVADSEDGNLLEKLPLYSP